MSKWYRYSKFHAVLRERLISLRVTFCLISYRLGPTLYLYVPCLFALRSAVICHITEVPLNAVYVCWRV